MRKRSKHSSADNRRESEIVQPQVAPRLPKTKRLAFATTMFLVPIILILILEAGLRLGGYGNDLALVRSVEENGRAWLEINPNVAQRYFGLRPEFARQAEEARVLRVKPSNGFRIICLGESTMAGFPYNRNATMPGILATYLKTLFPSREIEVVNLGIAAVNSYAVRDLIDEVIALQPDVVLIYVGHNEFYGALGVGSSFSLGGSRTLSNIYLHLLHYRCIYLLQRALGKISRLLRSQSKFPETPGTPVMQQMAGQQQIPYGGALFKSAGSIFKENIQDVISRCVASQTPVVIGNLVANLRDQPPFIARPVAELSEEDRQRWQSALAAGLKLLSSGQARAALQEFHMAAVMDSSDAELAYYRGKALLAAGDSVAAARSFSVARDLDLLRFRAPAAFNTIISDLCHKNRVPMVDIEKSFSRRSRAGIVGSELIAEHLHPTAHGYAVMAKAFLRTLHAAGLLPAPVDDARIAALSEAPEELKITVLDEEIGRLRILRLTSAWPFKQPVNLARHIDPTIAPAVREIATQYIGRKISWGEAHLELAKTMTAMKQHEVALAEYEALLQLFPEALGLLDNKGETLMSLQRYGNAYESFAQSMRQQVDSPFGPAGVGKACMFLGRYQEAEAAFGEAIRRDDKMHRFSPQYRSVIYYLWGGALTNLNRFDQAEVMLLEALRVDPNNSLAGSFLSTLRAQLHKAHQKSE